MNLAQRITSLLTSLTPGQLKAMPPAEAQQLSNELQRVYRELTAGQIVLDAQKATRSGVLADLKNGERAE